MPGVRILSAEDFEEEDDAAKGEDDTGGPRPTGVACPVGSRKEKDLFLSDRGSSPSSRRCPFVKPSNRLGDVKLSVAWKVAAPRKHRLIVKRRIESPRNDSLLYFRKRATDSLKASSSPFHSHIRCKMCRA
jgi:hypothetical protein